MVVEKRMDYSMLEEVGKLELDTISGYDVWLRNLVSITLVSTEPWIDPHRYSVRCLKD